MKASKNTDKSAPYRTVSLEKITAPTKAKGGPKASRITSDTDLRSGKRK